MRSILPGLFALFLFSNTAIADTFLLSRGAKIHVLDSPKEAIALNDIDEIEATRSLYLPAGTMAVEVGDSALQSPNRNYKLLLSETGVWGLFKPGRRDFFDHIWLRKLTNWAIQMAEDEGSNCPAPGDNDEMILIFPDIPSDAERTRGSEEQQIKAYPGDVFYNFLYQRRGEKVVGYFPSTFEDACYEVELDRDAVNIASITGMSGDISCSFGMDFDNFCIGRTLTRLRSNFFKNMRIRSNDHEERYACAVGGSVSLTAEEAVKTVESLAARLAVEAVYAKSEIEVKVEIEQLARSIVNLTRDYPKNFEILRNIYISGDGSATEVLEVWTKCPKEGSEILPLTGNETHTYYFSAQERPQIVLGKALAEKLKINMRESTGTWLISFPREVNVIGDHLSEVYKLTNEQFHFLMTRVILWQD